MLFCDLVGSTALGESTDPEALRARMRRYFEDLRVDPRAPRRHGREVRRRRGHGRLRDPGLARGRRAARRSRRGRRCAHAIAEHGLEARIGINTGEVVVGGEGETLVTGDAVNVAARLEQAAAAGEVLIGAETRLLVRDAVRVEAGRAARLKGKVGARRGVPAPRGSR